MAYIFFLLAFSLTIITVVIRIIEKNTTKKEKQFYLFDYFGWTKIINLKFKNIFLDFKIYLNIFSFFITGIFYLYKDFWLLKFFDISIIFNFLILKGKETFLQNNWTINYFFLNFISLLLFNSGAKLLITIFYFFILKKIIGFFDKDRKEIKHLKSKREFEIFFYRKHSFIWLINKIFYIFFYAISIYFLISINSNFAWIYLFLIYTFLLFFLFFIMWIIISRFYKKNKTDKGQKYFDWLWTNKESINNEFKNIFTYQMFDNIYDFKLNLLEKKSEMKFFFEVSKNHNFKIEDKIAVKLILKSFHFYVENLNRIIYKKEMLNSWKYIKEQNEF